MSIFQIHKSHLMTNQYYYTVYPVVSNFVKLHIKLEDTSIQIVKIILTHTIVILQRDIYGNAIE